jgi:adenylate cyclase
MNPSPVERKLAAILSADVKGYSRLMGEDEIATVRTLTAYREVMATLIQQHRGRVVDAPGDNLLAEFASAVDAVECAAAVQRELKSRNAELPVARRMEFRIGINLGDVIVEGERIYGDGVNIAARVEGLAEAGGLSISGMVYDQVKGKLALQYEPLGEHAVKNIREPVRVYRVLLEPRPAASAPRREQEAGRRPRRRAMLLLLCVSLVVAGGVAVWTRSFRAAVPVLGLPNKPSIAVLPFVNMSGDVGQEYFSDGITEDLTTGLSKLSGLFVIARNSTFAYKGEAVKPAQVSRELGVRYVLEGSVRKAGNRVRITAQLIDATTGYHLWAERYDRDLQDVFALQDEVTQKIVGSLAVQLTAPEQGQLRRTPTANLEAYDDVLRGMEYYRRTTTEANAEAQRMFRRALDLDPQYARAYVALGWAHLQGWTLQWSQDPQTLQRAFELAQQAIARDDSLALAHRLLSQVYLWKKQHERAIAEAGRAVTLGPNDADGYETLAEVLAWSGRAEEAIGFIKKAMRLNPQYPFFYLWTLGHAYYLTGRTQEAIDTLGKVLERNANFVPAHAFLAVLYGELGLEKAARAEGEQAARLSPQASLESLRHSVPYQDERDLGRFLAGMRKAGLE